MVLIDTSTSLGRRAEQRLRDEMVVWLTTISTDGRPIPVPVWFLWDGDSVLIYSRANQPKQRYIDANPNVSLNFDSDGGADGVGGDIVRFDGTARVDLDSSPAIEVDAYVEKYRQPIQKLGMTPETFSETYPVPIRVTPSKLRGFFVE